MRVITIVKSENWIRYRKLQGLSFPYVRRVQDIVHVEDDSLLIYRSKPSESLQDALLANLNDLPFNHMPTRIAVKLFTPIIMAVDYLYNGGINCVVTLD